MTESTANTSTAPGVSMPVAHPLRVAGLSGRAPVTIDIAPDAAQRDAIAAWLGIEGVPALSLRGRLVAGGRRDWRLEARLDAQVAQRCGVSLQPVTTRIDESVLRRYVDGLELPQEAEMEVPEDDTREPLGDVIDPAAVMLEALALAVPPFPRRDDAPVPGATVVTEPGKPPMRDEDARPFAALGALRDRLSGSDGGTGGAGPEGDDSDTTR